MARQIDQHGIDARLVERFAIFTMCPALDRQPCTSSALRPPDCAACICQEAIVPLAVCSIVGPVAPRGACCARLLPDLGTRLNSLNASLPVVCGQRVPANETNRCAMRFCACNIGADPVYVQR